MSLVVFMVVMIQILVFWVIKFSVEVKKHLKATLC